MFPDLATVLLILFGYALGSVSSAIVVCRALGLPDPRSQGSGNPGATNVLRIGGKRAAAITLAGDSLKGLLPVLLAWMLLQSPALVALVGAAAFLGHLYPVFFDFKGGKGVATALGVLFGLYWGLGLIVAVIWLLVARVFKISSLAALLSMALAPLLAWWLLASLQVALILFGMIALLVWRHRSNILNLWRGVESRVGQGGNR